MDNRKASRSAPKAAKPALAKEKGGSAKHRPDNKFTADMYVHVQDAVSGYGIVGAVVEVDPRSGGHEDPDPKSTTGVGSGPPHGDAVAEFDNVSTNGPAIYDIDVTHPDYYSDYKRQSILSSGPYHIYFYLEHV